MVPLKAVYWNSGRDNNLMDYIFAPSRMEFIKGEKPEGCVFCGNSCREDCLILYEDEMVVLIMNKYPYNTGHLLVVPQRHVRDLDQLTPQEHSALFTCVSRAAQILREEMKAEGINIGMNLGRAAGAGIDAHLHVHLVPRWGGDTNFMTCVSATRVVPENVEKTFEELKPHFQKMNREA